MFKGSDTSFAVAAGQGDLRLTPGFAAKMTSFEADIMLQADRDLQASDREQYGNEEVQQEAPEADEMQDIDESPKLLRKKSQSANLDGILGAANHRAMMPQSCDNPIPQQGR